MFASVMDIDRIKQFSTVEETVCSCYLLSFGQILMITFLSSRCVAMEFDALPDSLLSLKI